MKVPVLTIEASRSIFGEEFWSITIVCPYCARLHYHGSPMDGAPLGHRLSHCRDRREGGYTLIITEDTEFK